MAERAYGAPAPPTSTAVVGESWYGKDVDRERHTAVLFSALDMTEVMNRGSVFTDCTFRRARFTSSVHTEVAFVNCTFVACTFFDANFVDCKFVGSMFDGCMFDAMKAVGGDWSFAGLPGADLRKAAFNGTRLREVDLTGARCDGGVLRDVDLSGAWLHGVNFSRCDLRGSDLSAIEPAHAQLKGAVITTVQALAIAEALGMDVRPEA